ncbi:MAG: hypothetical protein QM487_03120 [Candidatus Marithrix sp.]
MKYLQILVYLIVLIASHTAKASPYISYNWKIVNQNCVSQAEKTISNTFHPLIAKRSFVVGSYSGYKGIILCVKNIMLFVVSGNNFSVTQQLTNKLKNTFINTKIISDYFIKSPVIAINWTVLNTNYCLKQANRSMKNSAFPTINKKSFVIGSKNDYKAMVLCINNQVFFIVTGVNFTIASNLANKLRNNFISAYKINPITEFSIKSTSISNIIATTNFNNEKSIGWLIKNYNTNIFPALSYLPATKQIVRNLISINPMAYEKLTQSLSSSQKQQIITSVRNQLKKLTKIDSTQVLQHLYQWVITADRLLQIKQNITLKEFVLSFYQFSITKSCFNYLQGIGISNSIELMSTTEMNSIQYCAFNKLATIPKAEFNKQLDELIDKFNKK